MKKMQRDMIMCIFTAFLEKQINLHPILRCAISERETKK